MYFILKPSNFLCLTLKLLQLQPEKDIVIAFIQNEEFKYLRLLGCLYLRLVGKPVEIYKYLEPLYNDYRKITLRSSSGWAIKHIDEFVDSLLYDELVCDIALPHLQKRLKLEDLGLLLPRKSALEIEFSNLKSNVAVQFDDENNNEDFLSVSNDILIINTDQGKYDKEKTLQKDMDMNPPNNTNKRKLGEGASNKRFDKLFKKVSAAEDSSNRTNLENNPNKKIEEFSVEYWNQRRNALGLKNLK